MRFSRTAALALAVCAIGLTACGSDGDESSATSTLTTTPTVPTETTDTTATTGTTTDGGAATPSTGTTTDDGGAAATGGDASDGATDADDAVPSGGVSPSGGTSDAGGTAGGDQPSITPGTADEPASAIAADASTLDLWCEQARQGAYDAQVGEATSLAITVRGSDDTRICELPR